ncbi:hypothetical protein EJ08DRAFT_175572 [Tothia fuscella]|uniref:Uncharacterized protein n=1 Tax=Tothia fuscella TaxID=1048955 RepID=A0A9P4TZU5_9PEZI|nr:hypothetical protein EJ08DRAFT_175572 [Tothia fuscella]
MAILQKDWDHGLTYESLNSANDGNGNAGPFDQEWSCLLDLYILGDYIKDHNFCNAIIDATIEKTITDKGHPTALPAAGFVTLSPDSTLQKLLVDFYVWAGKMEWYCGSESNVQSAPKNLWLLVALRFTEKAKDAKKMKKFPWIEDRCQYHEHKAGEPKCNS